MRWIETFITLLFVAAAPVLAQQRTSAVTGSVVTDDGRPIPDVRVHWTQLGRPLFIATDDDGRFHFDSAEIGSQKLTFEHVSEASSVSYIAELRADAVLDLSVVFSRQGNRGEGRWSIREKTEGAPDSAAPGRVISAEDLNALPNTEALWSFLNFTEPSVVADRFDISGMHSHRQLLIGVRGSSWRQNQTIQSGMTVSHPAGEGALVFPDLSTMENIVYSVGRSSNRHTGPGAHLELVPKLGGDELHGQTRLFVQGGALQDTNVIERFREFGITESDERWKHFVNGGFQLGGPLASSGWTYFTALSVRDAEKWIRNYDSPVSGTVAQETFNLAGEWSPRDRFAFYGAMQQRHEPQADASPQVTFDSSVRQFQTYRQAQAVWTRALSSGVLQARFGRAGSKLDADFQRNAAGQSEEDLFPGYVVDGVFPRSLRNDTEVFEMISNTRRGPAPLIAPFDAGVWEASATYATAFDRQGFRHHVSAGANYRHASFTQRNDVMGDVNLLFFQESPYAVRLLNTPVQTRDRIRQVALHASDNVTISRVSLTFGLNTDFSGGSSSLSDGRSANALGWTNVGGRVGMAFRMTTRRPLIFRAGVARIYDQPTVNPWNAANPEGLGVRLFSWNDANRDRLFQSEEAGTLLKVLGAPYTRLDPGLQNPVTSELTVGLTQGGLWRFTFEAFGFRRTTQRLMSLVNEGVPYSSYTPVQAIDYGQDAIVHTDDDQAITVFNQKPETLGQDRYLLTNPSGFSSHSEGMELRLRFASARVQADAVVTRYRAVAATAPGNSVQQNDTSALLGVFDDPNKAIFARGSTFFDRGTLGRLTATMDLAWKLKAALIGSYQDGLPFSRISVVQGLHQGIVGVNSLQRGPGEAGSDVGPMTTHYETLDLRFSRVFPIRKGSLTATVDVFNVRNLSLPTVEADTTSATEKWRFPVRFQTPRSLQLGLRYDW